MMVWVLIDVWGNRCSFNYRSKRDAEAERTRRNDGSIIINDFE